MTDLSIDSRNVGLDVLRSLAILLVMIEHGGNIFINYDLSFFRYIGFDGVSIFFVLSGFLIGRIILRLFEDKPSWLKLFRFLQRRWLRTLPNYFLVLVILILTSTLRGETLFWNETSKYFFFLQNFANSHPSFFPEAWSLSIEEWFYLVFPISLFLIALIMPLNADKLIKYCIVLLICALIIRFCLFLYLSNAAVDAQVYDGLFRKTVITRFDAPLYGVILASFLSRTTIEGILNYRKLARVGMILLVVHLLSYGFCFYHDNWFYASTLGFSLFATSVSLMIPWFMKLQFKKLIHAAVFSNISKWSYSLYLLNLTFVQVTLLSYLPFHWYLEDGFVLYICRYVAFWVLSFLLSYFMYKNFEKPIINYRNRDFPEI